MGHKTPPSIHRHYLWHSYQSCHQSAQSHPSYLHLRSPGSVRNKQTFMEEVTKTGLPHRPTPVCVTLNQMIFIWARYKTGSVRSYNFPFLELTVHTAYSPQHFQDTVNEPSLGNREIGSNWRPRNVGTLFQFFMHWSVREQSALQPPPPSGTKSWFPGKTNMWECDIHYRVQSTQVFYLATLKTSECTCTMI